MSLFGVDALLRAVIDPHSVTVNINAYGCPGNATPHTVQVNRTAIDLKTAAADRDSALDKSNREAARLSERLMSAESEVRRLSSELSSVDLSSWHHLTKLGADAGRLLKENVDLKVAMEIGAESAADQMRCAY